jgi:hypothetical protein
VDSDEEASDDHLFLRVIGDFGEPRDLLADVVAVLDSTPEPDLELIGSVGAGSLETLVRNHGADLWEEVERLARQNIRFRRALRSVWAYDSAEYDRRTQLLKELGEWWRVELRFVVEPYDLLGGTRLEWRAREVRGAIAPQELARILREIADSVEQEQAEASKPPRPDGPIGTAEELAEVLADEYAADECRIVGAPHRDDMRLFLMSLPNGRTMQSIVVDESGWKLQTLRPVNHWLPYSEGPPSDLGVFTEPLVEPVMPWRPSRSDGTSHTTLGADTYVSFWGVGRDEGLERFRVLRSSPK